MLWLAQLLSTPTHNGTQSFVRTCTFFEKQSNRRLASLSDTGKSLNLPMQMYVVFQPNKTFLILGHVGMTKWCNTNCNHNPPNCPSSHCLCDGEQPIAKCVPTSTYESKSARFPIFSHTFHESSVVQAP